MQIGVEKDQQRSGEHHLGAGAPGLHVGARRLEEAAPEAEVDRDIGEHRPRQRRRRREHRGALHDEEDAQKQRQEPGDSDDHAAVERVAVHHVVVGLLLPQADLGKRRVAELCDKGHDGAGIEGDAEDVGGVARQTLGRKALARRDCPDPLAAEIGGDQP
jgi:hypothetical protein